MLPGVVVHAVDPITWEAGGSELEASLVYKVSSVQPFVATGKCLFGLVLSWSLRQFGLSWTILQLTK